LPPLIDHGTARGADSWGLVFELAAFLFLVLAVDSRRDREARARNVALFGAGLAASLPAPLLFGAPLRDQLAYVIDDFAIPKDTSWGYILSLYPGQAARTVYYDCAT
jgi:hypothetical protein